MKILFVTSDVHSYYDQLIDGLNEAGFDENNEEHIFVSCGDLLDRGTFPTKCLQFVNSLPDNRKILIRGNHEIMLQDALNRGYLAGHDYWNGTAETVQYLSDYASDPYAADECELIDTARNNPEWRKYYSDTVYYKEIGDYIFTHAWLPYVVEGDTLALHPNWREESFKDCIWCNGMHVWSKGAKEPNKTIVCGHIHTAWGHVNLHGEDSTTESIRHMFRPFEDEGIICLDSRVPSTHFVNIKKIIIDD